MSTRQGWRNKPRRSDPRRAALVLAGGGVTGAAYEAGALLALEHLLDRSPVDFDAYLGISAGSVLSALLANGVAPVDMAATLADPEGRLFGYPASQLFRFDAKGTLRGVPRIAAEFLGLRSRRGSPADAAFGALDCLPEGFMSNEGVHEVVENAIAHNGGTNSFRELKKDLFVLAVDIDNGEVVAFGEPGWQDVPISRAVQASCAIPVFCRPVRIGDRHFVDGAVRKTAHLRRVIEDGATLVLCVNPMVPLGPLGGTRSVAHLLCETVRLTIHGRMQSALQSYAQEYPDTDVLVLEPSKEEVREAQVSLLRSSECPALVQLGYRSTVRRFRERADEWGRMLARHGVKMRDPFAIAEEVVLPAPPQPQAKVARRLDRSLQKLKGLLAARTAAASPDRA